ncbi:hypothetical protein Tsubulata_049274 [Turnera subulata]|uniref:Protein kinase domain-containing protein n=1 Tax=Turnera subulata TaxID=218843 RepID=A0A9Q0JPB2_9ROSI|nr:hypothetical protein Tsubulata_049274 [Turnera subulata]
MCLEAKLIEESALLYVSRLLVSFAGAMKDDLELPLFDFGTIACATNNFSVTNKLGQGGYGPVYKVKP